MTPLRAGQTDWTGWLLPAGLLLAALLLARPLWDMDLWWHLATGRVFWQQGAFLAADPFAYPGLAQPDPERFFLLNAYWLGQLLFYGWQSLFDLAGLIGLRILLLVCGPLVAYFWLRRRQVPPALALIPLLLGLWLGHYFSGLRPALFSFALFPVLLVLLEAAGLAGRHAGREDYDWRAAAGLVLLLPLWANLHPGFLLGAAILVIALVTEGRQAWCSGAGSVRRSYLLVAGLAVLALLATLCNPNGVEPYRALLLFEGSELQGRTSEYTSPVALLLQHGAGAWPYWLMAVLAPGLYAWRWRRPGLTRWVVLLALLAVSLQAQRYQPFFVLGAAVLLAPVLAPLAESPRWVRGGRLAALVLVACLGLAVLQHRADGWGQTLSGPVKADSMPQQALAFVAAERPQGRVFSHFNWGGYQTWILGGKEPVLIDGRSLKQTVFEDYTHLLWTERAMPILFDRYGINTVVVPRLKPFNGELYALTRYLARDPQWTLVHRDPVAMVLVRGAANRVLAARYGLPPQQIWSDVLAEAEANLAGGEPPAYAYQALAEAYGRLGLRAEAETALRQLQQVTGQGGRR